MFDDSANIFIVEWVILVDVVGGAHRLVSAMKRLAAANEKCGRFPWIEHGSQSLARFFRPVIAELVEDDESGSEDLRADPVVRCTSSRADHVVGPAAGAGADAASGDGNGHMGVAGAGPADQNGVAMLGDESTMGKLVDESFVNRRALTAARSPLSRCEH
jgi:hypothetical protein